MTPAPLLFHLETEKHVRAGMAPRDYCDSSAAASSIRAPARMPTME